MTIYGVALLAFCFLAGKIMGTLLGALLGFNGDIGGVGFAMVLLMVLTVYLKDICLLYTSPSPRDATLSRMPSSA